MKDKKKGNDVTKFRPITCLLTWQIFTGIHIDELFDNLESERLLPQEQNLESERLLPKKIEGTKDELLIDKMVLRNCKRQMMTVLGMAWIDYKNAFDMVSQSLLKK